MRPDVLVHWQHNGRLYCANRETPPNATAAPGEVFVTCATCFGPNAHPHPRSTSTGERVR